jgi:hypothetical protein
VNQQIKTGLGVVVILIFAVTAGVFVWLYEKNQDEDQANSCKRMIQVCGTENAGCRWECQDNFAPIKASISKPIAPTNNSITDENANWQTYRNEKYGFEIKYPQDFQKQNSDFGKVLFNATKENYFFTIYYTDNYNPDRNIGENKNIIAGNITGFKYTYREGVGISGVAVIQSGNGALNISIDYLGGNPSSSDIENFLDQILSTFKFIN